MLQSFLFGDFSVIMEEIYVNQDMINGFSIFQSFSWHASLFPPKLLPQKGLLTNQSTGGSLDEERRY
jgi:hypothetical protein